MDLSTAPNATRTTNQKDWTTTHSHKIITNSTPLRDRHPLHLRCFVHESNSTRNSFFASLLAIGYVNIIMEMEVSGFPCTECSGWVENDTRNSFLATLAILFRVPPTKSDRCQFELSDCFLFNFCLSHYSAVCNIVLQCATCYQYRLCVILETIIEGLDDKE